MPALHTVNRISTANRRLWIPFPAWATNFHQNCINTGIRAPKYFAYGQAIKNCVPILPQFSHRRTYSDNSHSKLALKPVYLPVPLLHNKSLLYMSFPFWRPSELEYVEG
jgi:hypothetical protein